MADYDLSGVWLNGEHLIIGDGHLSTREGLESNTWSVVIDGAHILSKDVDDRIMVRMATNDGHEVEGYARVTFPGHHPSGSKVYDDVRLEGLTTLHELH